MSAAVARRYAKALFALAKEAAALPQTAEHLGRLADVANDAAVGPVLRSPLLSATRRSDLAQMLARELALTDLLTRFIRLLADQQRLGELPAIAERFQHMLDAVLGRVRITVRSPRPLDPKQEADLIAVFTTLTSKQVLARVVIDAALLGGVVVEVEGKVYDGSVRTQLDRLAKEFSGAALP
jgi:F-type H+-transporting ATPase subunit delta